MAQDNSKQTSQQSLKPTWKKLLKNGLITGTAVSTFTLITSAYPPQFMRNTENETTSKNSSLNKTDFKNAAIFGGIGFFVGAVPWRKRKPIKPKNSSRTPR